MFGKLVPVPSGAVIPERDIGKRPILNCINLGVTFGGLKAVDDFNLMIGRTEIAGLIGPNGAGKTTVFNLLTKVYQPTHGTILLDGQDTHNMTTAQVNRAGIARTFQNIRLFNDLTVEENVTVAMDAQMKYNMVSGIFRLPSFWKEEKVAHERALELLSLFHMEDLANVKAGSLPYGAQRRLEIVRAVSALTGRPVDGGCALTGEISVQGQIKPVGGVPEKVEAARRAGLIRAYVPRENMQERFEDCGIDVRAIDTLAQALERVLLPAALSETEAEKQPARIAPLAAQGTGGEASCNG